MTRVFSFFALLSLFAFAPALGQAAQIKELTITDIKVGEGQTALNLDEVHVHYTGWLMDGTKFDSSRDRGLFKFTLGKGMVIRGWDAGVKGMKVGGKRELLIPYKMAYGLAGITNVIPRKADLKFEVELANITPVKFKDISVEKTKSLLAEGTKIIDLRRPLEWSETGVVDSSELITAFRKDGRSVKGFVEAIEAYAKPDEKLILICRTGNRSRMVAKYLADRKGYTNVFNVTKGIVKWKADGNPVTKPKLN